MKDEIARILKAFFPSAQAAYLFGSFGTEYERPDSDVDIALLLPAGTEGADMEECRYALEEDVGRPVDLVDLRRTNTVFQYEVVTTGRPLFIADSRAAHLFEMLVMSLYQKLGEERAGIVAAILETGRVLR